LVTGVHVKKLFLVSISTTGAGVLLATALQVIAGIDYRVQEDRGLEPGYSPVAVGFWTEVGLWVFAVGALASIVTGVLWARSPGVPRNGPDHSHR
jgi:hypothetical protein